MTNNDESGDGGPGGWSETRTRPGAGLLGGGGAPRAPVPSPSSLLLSSLEMSDKKVYEPEIRTLVPSADYSQVGVLSVWHEFVNFGAERGKSVNCGAEIHQLWSGKGLARMVRANRFRQSG